MTPIPRVTKLGFGMSALAAIAISLSGCGALPTPFEQDVPQTQWTVDKDGNKVKVQTGASEAKTTPQQVQEAGEKFYDGLLNEDNRDEIEKGTELLAAFDTEGKAPETKEEKAKQLKAIREVQDVWPSMFDHVHMEGMKDDDEAFLTGALYLVAIFSNGTMEAEVPLKAITVKNDKATIDERDIIMRYSSGDQKGKIIEQEAEESDLVSLIKVDGEWKVDGKQFATTLKESIDKK